MLIDLEWVRYVLSLSPRLPSGFWFMVEKGIERLTELKNNRPG